ncbi:hypothetical protein ACNQP7_04680 [Mycolicibacterium fortuitum]|uniref:hypothetical protein n=1 Tax=Mycolicibacterium fortuitum TaxID=1766 RepID=UPI003AAD0D84
MAPLMAQWGIDGKVNEQVAVHRDNLRERLIAFEYVVMTRFTVPNNTTRYLLGLTER